MVKKAVVAMTIVMGLMILITVYGFIATRPLEIPIENFEIDVNQKEEVIEEKKELARQVAISSYDPIFKEVCSEYGNDWRFMSAMAYHESRFRPDATSSQGAQGMMQIMPHIAEFFEVSKEDLTDVQTNIMVANKLVNRITKMLKLTDATPQRDRMGLILASYNGGIGYVLNARKLARENGEDANSWDVVSKYLKAMKCPEFAAANNVRHFRGVGQTIAYVNNVIGHYNHYCEIAML